MIEDDETLLSPEDMRKWLEVEVKQVRLAATRRIKEATSIFTDYAAGRLSHEEAL